MESALWGEKKNQNGCISNHFAAKFKDKNEMNMCYLRNQMTNRKATLIHQIAFTAMATANKHRKRHKSIDIIHWHRTIHTIYYIDINDRWRSARKMDTHIVSKQASQRLYFGKKNWKISAIYCRYESDYGAMMTDGLTSFYD